MNRQLFPDSSGATFSPCNKYRYMLWRKLKAAAHDDYRWLNFIMLNPSTADETVNDPTVERCERRAKMWGYDGLIVTNIFAWRSTDPKALRGLSDPVGPQNNQYIADCARSSNLVICAWGSASPLAPARARHVLKMLRENGIQPHALKVTEKTGIPWHPLYLRYDLQPKPLPFDPKGTPCLS